jgi:two-component system sensor histidine kinase KdpD
MSEAERPDPDALLAQLKREEAESTRGKLKIFFGMCPGVGKTYAMLQAARQKQAEGCEVVVGIVETHGRKETEALLEGMPIMPRAQIEYRGTTLTEMDLDAILTWHPGLAVVDELAHTNAPGSRHPKRYQDVLELLDAGIDVYTTLNVQHVASRSDTVRQITGAPVTETVPDSVFDLADEIVLVDLTPEQLRSRMAEGKVYLGERAEWAAKNFFRESNLTALREMALRIVAEHVDRSLRDIMSEERITGPMEEWRPVARRGQREPILRTIDSLHPAAGVVHGGLMDCRQHRAATSFVAGGTNALDPLSRAGASVRRGSDFYAGR